MVARTALFLCFAIAMGVSAQPSRDELLKAPEHADEDFRPAFKTFEPGQIHEGVEVSLVEIEHGDARVPAIAVQLPDADNDAYGAVVFDTIHLEDRKGKPIEWSLSDGMTTREQRQTRLVLLGADGEAVPLGNAKGRVVVWYPTSVTTRTIKASEKDARAKQGLFIDGPFVRYRVSHDVARVTGMSDVESVRAYDAAGKRVEPDGGFWPDEEHEGFELRPFRGAVARVEVDGVSEVAGVAIEYELVPGAAAKITKTPLRTLPMAVLDWAMGLSRAQIVQELAQRNYPALDRDQFMTAIVNDDVDAMRLFLASGFDFEAGKTPPMVAAATAGRFEAANFLLDAGANPNALDEMGVSAMTRLAANCAATATIEKLLARGADPNAKGSAPLPPLALAKAMQCKGNIAALEKAGAK